MQRKNTWIILGFFLLIVFTASSIYYFNSSKNQVISGSQFSDEKEFLDVSSLERVSYFFGDDNTFEKSSESMISSENYKTDDVVSKKEIMDLDNDFITEECSLENGLLTITKNSKIVWQSPNDWWIDDFIIADSNNDGILNINLSLWKAGNFGSSKPFWVEENDMSVKNHFFVYNFIDDKMEQVWGSSNLSNPNCEFQIEDIDNDGKNDLIVIEGDYSENQKCSGNYVAVWKWNGWGFSNEWRSEKGNFSNLKIENNKGKNLIIINSF
jgi:poly-gamma-glutamate synthesis protein (capsule biosynthesis protein)